MIREVRAVGSDLASDGPSVTHLRRICAQQESL